MLRTIQASSSGARVQSVRNSHISVGAIYAEGLVYVYINVFNHNVCDNNLLMRVYLTHVTVSQKLTPHDYPLAPQGLYALK
jgi:hypothetical protein